jgi:preprotein translocase subunit SecG
MDLLWIVMSVLFFVICLAYAGFLAKEGKIWKT